MTTVGARFGRTVRRNREALGWSQETLAGCAKLNRSYLGDIERGLSIPTIATAVKLAEALGTSLAVLIERFERADA